MRTQYVLFIVFFAILFFGLYPDAVLAEDVKGCPYDSVIFVSPKEDDRCSICGGTLERVEEARIGRDRDKNFIINTLTGLPRKGNFVAVYTERRTAKKSFVPNTSWQKDIVELKYACGDKVLSANSISCPPGLKSIQLGDTPAEIERKNKEAREGAVRDLKAQGATDAEIEQIFATEN